MDNSSFIDRERAYMIGSSLDSRLYTPIERSPVKMDEPRDYVPYKATYISEDTRALFPEDNPNIYK